VATELIFGGVLAELEPEEAVALLAALVFQVGGMGWRKWGVEVAPACLLVLAGRCCQAGIACLTQLPPTFPPSPLQEKNASEPELTPRLEGARADAVSLALHAGLVQQECGLALTPEEFVNATLKFGLSEVRSSSNAGWVQSSAEYSAASAAVRCAALMLEFMALHWPQIHRSCRPACAPPLAVHCPMPPPTWPLLACTPPCRWCTSGRGARLSRTSAS
jgi:hypothetical protein